MIKLKHFALVVFVLCAYTIANSAGGTRSLVPAEISPIPGCDPRKSGKLTWRPTLSNTAGAAASDTIILNHIFEFDRLNFVPSYLTMLLKIRTADPATAANDDVQGDLGFEVYGDSVVYGYFPTAAAPDTTWPGATGLTKQKVWYLVDTIQCAATGSGNAVEDSLWSGSNIGGAVATTPLFKIPAFAEKGRLIWMAGSANDSVGTIEVWYNIVE